MYTRVLISVLVLLIIIVYINYYSSYKHDYNILQSYLDQIDLNLVYEKYPIIIYDQLLNPEELTKTLFAYSYAFKKNSVQQVPLHPTMNSSKHMIIWCKRDSIMNIINPKYKQYFKWKRVNGMWVSEKSLKDVEDASVQYVTLKIKKNQVVILPAFWIFDCTFDINTIQLDDILSIISR